MSVLAERDYGAAGGAGGGGGGSWGDDTDYVIITPEIDSPSELDYSDSPYFTTWFPAVLTVVSASNSNVNCQLSDGTDTRDYWYSNLINNPYLYVYQVRQAYPSKTFTTVIGFHYGQSFQQTPYTAWYIFDSSSADSWLSAGAKLYRLTENDIQQTGLDNSLDDPQFNGSNWFEFLYNFGGGLLGSNSLSELLGTEVFGQSFLSLMFGAGFLVFAGYVVLKWVLPS